MESMFAVNIIQGFKTTGIYPLNQEAVLKKLPGTTAPPPKPGNVCPVFTPRKRQPQVRTDLSTPIIEDSESQGGVSINSPLEGPGQDNSPVKKSSMHDILSLNTPTFKVKDLHIKPNPAGYVVTSKESIQAAEIKKQERNKKKNIKQNPEESTNLRSKGEAIIAIIICN